MALIARRGGRETRQAAHDQFRVVFTRGGGTPIHPDRFTQMFDKLVKASDLPRIRRMTSGLPTPPSPSRPTSTKVVTDRLGHATIAFTLDVYSHAAPALQRMPPTSWPA